MTNLVVLRKRRAARSWQEGAARPGPLKVLLGLAILGGASFLALGFFVGGDIGVTVDSNAPDQVSVGENFEFRVTVDNTDDERHKLVAIDIWDEYLEGIDIKSTDPEYVETFHVPFDNTQSYVFNIDLAPGEDATVTFRAVATSPGVFDASYDVCVDSDTNFATFPIKTIVSGSK